MNLEALETSQLIDLYKNIKDFLNYLEKESKQYKE